MLLGCRQIKVVAIRIKDWIISVSEMWIIPVSEMWLLLILREGH